MKTQTTWLIIFALLGFAVGRKTTPATFVHNDQPDYMFASLSRFEPSKQLPLYSMLRENDENNTAFKAIVINNTSNTLSIWTSQGSVLLRSGATKTLASSDNPVLVLIEQDTRFVPERNRQIMTVQF